MKYILNFAVGQEHDAIEQVFETKEKLKVFVRGLREYKNIVWLFGEANDEITITESVDIILLMIENSRNYEFILQQYNSYEGAYKVALLIKEPNKLCYEPKK